MGENEPESKRVTQLTKAITGNKNTVAGIQTILSAIPYAGGPLATVLSEYRTQRAFEKVYGTMDKLKNAIESQQKDLSEILKPDEIIELVQKTLKEIVDTSSEEKIEYLNNVLIKSFTSGEISYSQKQHYLEVLRSLSAGEIQLLRTLYSSGDPFDNSLQDESGNPAFLTAANNLVVGLHTDIYEEPESGESLSEKLQSRMSGMSYGALQGIIKSLDSKGLSEITPNLGKKTIKKRGSSDLPLSLTINMISMTGADEQTPYEASRTAFGRDFIGYISSWN